MQNLAKIKQDQISGKEYRDNKIRWKQVKEVMAALNAGFTFNLTNKEIVRYAN